MLPTSGRSALDNVSFRMVRPLTGGFLVLTTLKFVDFISYKMYKTSTEDDIYNLTVNTENNSRKSLLICQLKLSITKTCIKLSFFYF